MTQRETKIQRQSYRNTIVRGNEKQKDRDRKEAEGQKERQRDNETQRNRDRNIEDVKEVRETE